MTDVLACKLTPIKLQQRKASLVAELRNRIIETAETEKGFRYRFGWTEETGDLVKRFIDAERQCCDFLNFSKSLTDDRLFLLMEISGPCGTKDFIRTTLELGRASAE